MNAFKFSLKKGIIYLMLLGFLFPMGYANYYSSYKNFQAIYLFFLLIIILIIYFYRFLQGQLNLDKSSLLLISYSLALLFITLWKQGGINQGFQKIFVIPGVCLLLADYLQRSPKMVIDSLCNTLLLLLILNITVFNQLIFPQLFSVDNHIMFIGHVQVASEIGLLAVYVGYLKAMNPDGKFEGYLLMIVAFVNMLYAETSASYIAIFELLVFMILGRNTGFRRFISKSVIVLTLILIIISGFIINIKIDSNTYFLNTILNGRLFIWNQGMDLVKESPLFGYGAYGVKIQVFWNQWVNNGIGFNYAHNAILQLLLDGGIVLMVIFIIAVLSYIKTINIIHNGKLRYISCVIMLVFITVGLVESLTEYNYFFIFLSILPYLIYLEPLYGGTNELFKKDIS